MKTVLVTGGTTRLGKVIADGLRERGWRVLTSSHRPKAGADIVADLTNPDAADELYAAACAKAGGSLDAIVNNAALYVADADDIWSVNLVAPRRLTKLLSQRKSPGAAVVNIIDAKALGLGESEIPYLDSKCSLISATQTDAMNLAATVRVNAVAPGPVLAPTAIREKAEPMVLARRPTAADVAQAVAYLLDAEAVTGIILPVDSGQHILKYWNAGED